MASIAEVFKTYASYENIPVIGIINWNSSLAPDKNVTVVFVFNYVMMAYSLSGSMFTSTREDPTWIKR